MNKEKLIEKAEKSFNDIIEFNEYSQHCEELLIKVLPYLSNVGLQLVIAENKEVFSQMYGED